LPLLFVLLVEWTWNLDVELSHDTILVVVKLNRAAISSILLVCDRCQTIASHFAKAIAGKSPMPLTDKQKRFVDEYLVDLNATAE
jgi:hypothetical protein